MILKVCGCGSIAENPGLYELDGVDYFGFIFYPKSPRNVESTPCIPVRKAGVFVNENPDVILRRISEEQLSVVQFHGNETPEEIRQLKSHVIKWKAFGIQQPSDFLICGNYEGVVDCFLFDTRTDHFGGSGTSFDWKLLDAYNGKTPFILSGGISLAHLEQIRQLNHPELIGIDINSRFEIAPKQKNIELLRTFIKHFKNGTKK